MHLGLASVLRSRAHLSNMLLLQIRIQRASHIPPQGEPSSPMSIVKVIYLSRKLRAKQNQSIHIVTAFSMSYILWLQCDYIAKKEALLRNPI